MEVAFKPFPDVFATCSCGEYAMKSARKTGENDQNARERTQRTGTWTRLVCRQQHTVPTSHLALQTRYESPASARRNETCFQPIARPSPLHIASCGVVSLCAPPQVPSFVTSSFLHALYAWDTQCLGGPHHSRLEGSQEAQVAWQQRGRFVALDSRF